jgi:diguanylate cyclase (GGDEF)-like protein
MRALEELISQQEAGPRNAATVATLQGARRALERDFTEWARRMGETEQRDVTESTRQHLLQLQGAVAGLRAALGWTQDTAAAPPMSLEGVDRAYLAAVEASQATVLASVRGGADRAVLYGYTAGDLAAALVVGASGLALLLGGAVIALLGQAQHENRAAMGIMGELLRTDPLTGVTNRRGLDENLPVEMARARRGELPLTVAMLDLDFFKRYNSRRGHAGGDSLLRTAAQSWRKQLRPTDTLVRYGGEEFTLVLPTCDSDQACQLIARLRPLMPDNQTFSAGVATWDFRESGDELLRRADNALLLAKKNGRNRTMVSGQEDQISLPLATK